jgi:glycosyltransferase involved in cell wall biosynthesis
VRIALLEYKVTPTNPSGGCCRLLIEGLNAKQEFTVFASDFDNPAPGRVGFVRVPTPRRPLVLQYLAFHLLAPLARRRAGARFALVQSVESAALGADVIYAHFCHRAFVREQAQRPASLRPNDVLRWVDHRLRAATEPIVYRGVREVVVPSEGLKRDIERHLPNRDRRITVIPNPIDVAGFRRPPTHDRAGLRRALGCGENDLLLAFVALGHFERKGLPALLQALAALGRPDLRLVVIGGRASLVRQHEATARRLGLGECARFVGMTDDVRPYLWGADAFVLPSRYETFSKVCFEAAATGLPLVVPPLHGVEEIARDGETAILISPDAASVTRALQRLLEMSEERRRAMGEAAARAVVDYAPDAFLRRWEEFYDRFEADAATHAFEAAP